MANLYLLVEDPALLDACRDWRRRYVEARRAGYELAVSIGARGVFFDTVNETAVNALALVLPLPPGWARVKMKRKSDHPRMVPAKGPDGDTARAAISALPKGPKLQEIKDLIGHPCTVSYSTPDGSYGFTDTGNLFRPVALSWPGGDDAFIIVCPDASGDIADILKRHPDATIKVGYWQPPAGVRLITKARCDLIFVEALVRAEEAAKEKTKTT